MSKPVSQQQMGKFALRSTSFHLGLMGWMMFAHVGKVGAAVVWTVATLFFLGSFVPWKSEE